jgi:hypothetical protein
MSTDSVRIAQPVVLSLEDLRTGRVAAIEHGLTYLLIQMSRERAFREAGRGIWPQLSWNIGCERCPFRIRWPSSPSIVLCLVSWESVGTGVG